MSSQTIPNNVVPIERYHRFYERLLKLVGYRMTHLYAVLFFKCGSNGRCWPSQLTLADEVGCTVRQLQRTLVALQKLKLIDWKRTQSTNHYVVFPFNEAWIADFENHASHQNVVSDAAKMSCPDATVRSHRNNKDHHQKLKDKPPEAKPAASVVEATSQPTQHPAEVATPLPHPKPQPPLPKPAPKPEPEKAKASFSQKVDDDEKPKAEEVKVYATPEAELRARWEARWPKWDPIDCNECLFDIKRILNGTKLESFLQFDLEKTTGKPSAFKNVHGYYVNLASKFMCRLANQISQGSAFIREFQRATTIDPAREMRDIEGAHCKKCDQGRLPAGSYCSCPKGPNAQAIDAMQMDPSYIARRARAVA